MTARNHNRTLQGRARVLAALGVTSLALIAASPANAIYRSAETTSDEPPVTQRSVDQTNETPVDEDGKKSCWYKGDWLRHGTTGTIWWTNSDGKVIMQTMKCDDGRWIFDYSPTSDADGDHFEADTYSTSGGSYAQP